MRKLSGILTRYIIEGKGYNYAINTLSKYSLKTTHSSNIIIH